MAKRTRYTPEQRAERAASDRALKSEATETLKDPAALAALLATLTACRSPKVLGYSLRNQALLVKQAAERGFVLTDVDTFKGWLARGRMVVSGKGSGLRIVRPRGAEEGTDASDEGEAVTTRGEQRTAPGGSGESDEPAAGRERFFMSAVFDISQTAGIEDAELVEGPREVPNPAAVLADTLVDQLERRGWQVREDAASTTTQVDDVDRVVTVPVGRPVAELGRVVAAQLTAKATNTSAA